VQIIHGLSLGMRLRKRVSEHAEITNDLDYTKSHGARRLLSRTTT